MTRRRIGAALACVVCAVACALGITAASAEPSQGTADVVVEGVEPAIRCLVVPAGSIDYPAEQEPFKARGTVRVGLVFSGGQERPRVDVLFASSEAFRELVVDRVKGYRLPCLARGESLAVTQEFEFVPSSARGIVAREPHSDRRQNKALSCVTGGERPPEYPNASSRRDVTHGRVLARAEFSAPGVPPRVEIVFDGGNDRFANVVRRHMAGYGLPCLGPTDFPVVLRQQFEFRMEGEPVTVLKDAALASFVRNVAGIDAHHVRFDFATMGCPFDVHFVLWQPHAMNFVREIGNVDPNRREFLEWLRTLDLNAPKQLHDEIVGDSMTISVPCGILDLA